ncbi:MAG: cbb3-type cytochrome c oxidase subunit II [Nitrospirae bacterium]|nr:cbb3-type cytochrome c oxidase subunit II [Nitrospirota bacterium]
MNKIPTAEKFATIALFVGIVFFAFGTFWQAVAPYLSLKDIPVKSMEKIAEDIPAEFYMLASDYPEEFKKYLGEPGKASFIAALETGKKVYIAEACWHCHSQYVRPVSKEEERYGKVSYPSEYANAMQLPQLLGTRRVGPDLIRESGVHSNDWHIAHFQNPPSVTPGSVMPSYGWLFDKDGRPNKKGLSLVAYMQWLGSWAKPPVYELSQR